MSELGKTLRDHNRISTYIFATLAIAMLFSAWRHPDTGVPEPGPSLVVYELFYADGRIWQRVGPINGDSLPATWAAAIYDAGEPICTGSGSWIYTPRDEPLPMTAAFWTGDAACTLIEGQPYRGRGVWSWRDAQGRQHQIEQVFDFIHEEGSR